MKNENKSSVRPAPISPATPASESRIEAPRVLTPAQWIRAVHGVSAPFGHDHMPTVFG